MGMLRAIPRKVDAPTMANAPRGVIREKMTPCPGGDDCQKCAVGQTRRQQATLSPGTQAAPFDQHFSCQQDGGEENRHLSRKAELRRDSAVARQFRQKDHQNPQYREIEHIEKNDLVLPGRFARLHRLSA